MSGRAKPASNLDPDAHATPLATPREIADAAARLRAGHLVAFPTETVYGLGADALSAEAVARVFEAKGRPAHNPLIVHVLDAAILAPGLVASWPTRAAALAAAFWPGPLTIIVPRGRLVPLSVTGGGETVALRSPNHAIARALLKAFGGPLVGPSANKSGRVSPTTAAHVRSEFDLAQVTVLDGGPCHVGIESTVVSVVGPQATVLRPGSVLASEIAAVLREDVVSAGALGPGALPSPGMLSSHYAPRTRVELVSTSQLPARLATMQASTCVVLTLASDERSTPNAARIAMPPEAAAYAARLYAALREADAMSHDLILVELPDAASASTLLPSSPWAAVLDRLKRASAGRDRSGSADG